jgi:hypothetical protein
MERADLAPEKGSPHTNDPLNFFEPFEHARANHESQLKRAADDLLQPSEIKAIALGLATQLPAA